MAETKEIRVLRADEIECRVGQCGKTQNGAWCSLLLYKDARCDQRILDELFGMFGWQRKHDVINGQMCCTVSIKDQATGEWIGKQDVGVESNTEAVKGSFSDSFKRACFNWGIGRELYTSPKIFINLNKDEWKDDNGKVKVSAKTIFIVKEIGYDEARNINKLVIVDRVGNTRYKLNEEPQKEPSSMSDEERDFNDVLNGYIIPALEQARTQEDVKRVWDEYADYQKLQKFIDVIMSYKNKVS